MDAMDRAILELLVEDARLTHDQIGERLGRSKSTVRDRIHRMERGGVIRGYQARVDMQGLGYHTEGLVACNLPADRMESITEALLRHPNVVEVLYVTGERRVIVRVVAWDNAHLRHLVTRLIIPAGATDVQSMVVMQAQSLLSSRRLPPATKDVLQATFTGRTADSAPAARP